MQGRRGHSSRLPASRLPAIAPRDEQPASSSTSQAQPGASLSSSIATDLPRNRLPPRSRNGCWTCRQRKVKCDEAKPECNQCIRLGHTCDYSNKVVFKDETRKVVDKYLGGGRVRGDNWDPAAELNEDEEWASADEDVLPNFTTLTNDEDWQKKAVHKPPGTYYVVANPTSFQNLEEYNRGRDDSRNRSSNPSRNRDPMSQSSENIAVDPKTIVLGTFEDESLRTSQWSLASPTERSVGTSHPSPAPSPALTTFTQSLGNLTVSAPQPLQQGQRTAANPTEQEARLLRHYKSFVRQHIVQIHYHEDSRDASGRPIQYADLFEREAANFPPLFYAMLALSALSLSHRDRTQNVDALTYSHQALGPLLSSPRTDQDLASNGTFLTHFILLIYEIAAAEPMWPTHLATLNRVIQIRRNVYGQEPFPAVLWWVCVIDIHALLSGSGRGSFVGNLISNGHVPTTTELLQTRDLFEASPASMEEAAMLPAILDFHRTILLLAADLGFLAKDLREMAERLTPMEQPRAAAIRVRQWHQRVQAIRDQLKRTWRMEIPLGMAADSRAQGMPARLRGIFEHTYLIYRTCIIYSHTSMWPTQRIDTATPYEHEVSQCASEIIGVAEETVRQRQYEHGFVMFPLFLAGVVASSPLEKMQAHELMRAMERESLGHNKRATRKLLEAVYDQQNERQMEVGHTMDVDWIRIMGETGLQIVHFGL